MTATAVIPAEGGLDLHEELSHPAGSCTCRKPYLFLRSSAGELVPTRGKCVNHCEYCAKLAAVENSEMLALDAMEGEAPEVWLVLTTRRSTIDMAVFYKAREQLLRAIRRRWPDADYACLLEFTTGYGPRSGGKRRPHWNVLLKRVPTSGIPELEELVARIWCARVDALPTGQHVGPVQEAGGLMRYIALHFQKESQRPPEGFTGQRFNCSRGYFTGATRRVARERARSSLRLKRELHRLRSRFEVDLELELVTATELDELALANRRRAAEEVWTLCNDRGARLGDVAYDRRRLAPELVRHAVAELHHVHELLVAARLAFDGPYQLELTESRRQDRDRVVSPDGQRRDVGQGRGGEPR
jgi:hypothetical protein